MVIFSHLTCIFPSLGTLPTKSMFKFHPFKIASNSKKFTINLARATQLLESPITHYITDLCTEGRGEMVSILGVAVYKVSVVTAHRVKAATGNI